MTAEGPPNPRGSERIARLSKADADAIDQLFEHGLDDSNPDDPRERAALDLLSVLEDYPTEEGSDELVDATLARVNREESERASRFSIANAPGIRGRQIRLPDFFAAAAALFLAVGIGWPLYQLIDRQNNILHSQARLKEYGAGIVSFAGENNDALPLDPDAIRSSGHSMDDLPCAVDGNYGTQLLNALAGPSQTTGDQTPEERYISPGFERAERIRLEKIGPVSYRVPMSVATFKLKAYNPEEPLVADPNPLVKTMRGSLPAHHLNSHEQGSHIHDEPLIVVVRFDLSIKSLPSPVLSDGDNIWVDHDFSSTEPIRPEDLEDAILAH